MCRFLHMSGRILHTALPSSGLVVAHRPGSVLSKPFGPICFCLHDVVLSGLSMPRECLAPAIILPFRTTINYLRARGAGAAHAHPRVYPRLAPHAPQHCTHAHNTGLLHALGLQEEFPPFGHESLLFEAYFIRGRSRSSPSGRLRLTLTKYRKADDR